MPKTRRQFLADSTNFLAAAGFVGLVPAAAASTFAATSKKSPNDKIVLGVLEQKAKGWQIYANNFFTNIDLFSLQRHRIFLVEIFFFLKLLTAITNPFCLPIGCLQ